jgi:hypothetical protein
MSLGINTLLAAGIAVTVIVMVMLQHRGWFK